MPHLPGRPSQQCRTWRGLCLVRLWHPGAGRSGFLEFSDGKVYQVSPLFVSDLARYPSRRQQPGCFFNQELRRRPGFVAVRHSSWPDFALGAGVLVDLRSITAG